MLSDGGFLHLVNILIPEVCQYKLRFL